MGPPAGICTLAGPHQTPLFTFTLESGWNLYPPLPSLVARLVKNPPAMQETLVRFLGWEDPLEKG